MRRFLECVEFEKERQRNLLMKYVVESKSDVELKDSLAIISETYQVTEQEIEESENMDLCQCIQSARKNTYHDQEKAVNWVLQHIHKLPAEQLSHLLENGILELFNRHLESDYFNREDIAKATELLVEDCDSVNLGHKCLLTSGIMTHLIDFERLVEIALIAEEELELGLTA